MFALSTAVESASAPVVALSTAVESPSTLVVALSTAVESPSTLVVALSTGVVIVTAAFCDYCLLLKVHLHSFHSQSMCHLLTLPFVCNENLLVTKNTILMLSLCEIKENTYTTCFTSYRL